MSAATDVPDGKPAPRGGSGEMFDAIAGRYDLLNRLLSLGIDQGWRRKTVAALRLAAGARVLDVATGTADLAIQIARTHEGVTVVGLDPSSGMLAVGTGLATVTLLVCVYVSGAPSLRITAVIGSRKLEPVTVIV